MPPPATNARALTRAAAWAVRAAPLREPGEHHESKGQPEDRGCETDPDLVRREDPPSPGAVLAWAGEPLATSEVAAVMNVAIGDAMERLTPSASFSSAGLDGYWSLEDAREG